MHQRQTWLLGEAGVGLRFETVEEIFHRTSGWDPKFQKDTNTVGTQVGVLIDGKGTSCRFLLESESEIASVTEKVVGVFRKFALPYFAQFGSLAAIDTELNDHPAERSVNTSLAWFRCSRGLIVAKLTGRPDYEQLATFYLNVMTRDNKGFYLKRFEALVESLKSVERGAAGGPLRDNSRKRDCNGKSRSSACGEG